MKVREELLDILGKKSRRNLALTHKLFYEFGNKSGKLLAKTLHSKLADTTIHSISDPSGKKICISAEIASHFHAFYSKLYNLSTPVSGDQIINRRKMITDFLSHYSPGPITSAEAANLDKPIGWDESLNALKQLKTGKCPGPDGLSVSYFKTFTDSIIPHFLKTFN